MKRLFHAFAGLMILTGAVFTAPVFAQLEGNPENFCRNGFFPRESRDFKLARVAGKPNERIYFYGDEREDCPGGKNCRLKSYLIPGDEVIVSRVFGEYACGWFQPAKKGGETVGWLKTDNLEWLETNRKTAADWLGEWLFYDNAIVIKQSKTPGLLDVSGDATWKGLGDNVHVGEIDESARPAGDRLNLGENETEEYACKVSMQFVGNYLVVGDNLRCGGVNVTFSGVYRKKAGK